VTAFHHDVLGSTTVILPGDEEYERASTVSARRGEPAIIVRPADAAQTADAVRLARENGLVLSIRCGGHSGSGHGTNDGGMVIDLSGLHTVEVLEGDRVRIGGGTTWGAVAETLRTFDLAVTSGDTASVGVGGLTLGGGVGWMVRERGLALDNLLEAEVVTADGSILVANAGENADLFWAIRGGGGNFGVVTSFTFQAQQLDGVHAGAISFGATDVAALLRGWRDVMRAAPERLNTTFFAMPAFGDSPGGAQVLVCYAGSDEAAASAAIAPLLALPAVSGSSIERTAYSEILVESQHAPEGVRVLDNNAFAADFSDEVVVAVARMYAALPGSVLMIRYLRGAFNRVEPDATAFGYRDSEVLLISAAFFPPDAPTEALERYQAQWNTLLPYIQGLYGNFTSITSEIATPLMYPPATLERLREVKGRYDPENLFDQNLNIVPAAMSLR
jgi:FAD/FMN-containing dehydrogenase